MIENVLLSSYCLDGHSANDDATLKSTTSHSTLHMHSVFPSSIDLMTPSTQSLSEWWASSLTMRQGLSSPLGKIYQSTQMIFKNIRSEFRIETITCLYPSRDSRGESTHMQVQSGWRDKIFDIAAKMKDQSTYCRSTISYGNLLASCTSM